MIFWFRNSGEDKSISLEQPEIEFLTTDKFGIVQTGKRPIPGMMVDFRGSQIPTFQSNKVNSVLFGQALTSQGPNYVYIDAPGTSLQFTGNMAALDSFTVGTFVYLPQTLNIYFAEIVIHGYSGEQPDNYYFRLMPHVSSSDGLIKMFSQNPTGDPGYTQMNGAYVPAEKLTGWVHLAFSFDASSRLLKTYFDGQQVQSQTLSTWLSSGTGGAY